LLVQTIRSKSVDPAAENVTTPFEMDEIAQFPVG
jgi:hypothetical protein